MPAYFSCKRHQQKTSTGQAFVGQPIPKNNQLSKFPVRIFHNLHHFESLLGFGVGVHFSEAPRQSPAKSYLFEINFPISFSTPTPPIRVTFRLSDKSAVIYKNYSFFAAVRHYQFEWYYLSTAWIPTTTKLGQKRRVSSPKSSTNLPCFSLAGFCWLPSKFFRFLHKECLSEPTKKKPDQPWIRGWKHNFPTLPTLK